MTPPNPLLADAFPPAFAEIRAEHVLPAVEQLLALSQTRMDALSARDDEPTFGNTMRALEAMTEQLDRVMGIVSHLEAVATSTPLREASTKAQEQVSAFVSQIPLSAPLYARIARYAQSDEAKALTGNRRRFVDKTMKYFKRHGAELPAEAKARLSAIDVELTSLTLKYSQNVLDATNAFELLIEDEAQLAGLPDSAKQAARQSAEAKGLSGYRFTLQAPSYVPLLTYLDDAAIRERVYRAAVSRASHGDHDNRPIVARVLALRAEKAKLLGYRDFADFVTEERMAKSGTKARSFVADLRTRTEDSFKAETSALAAFRRELEGADAAPLSAWDVAYYAEKERQARYQLDGEQLRPYFAFKRVLAGLFEIVSRLYSIRIEPWEQAQAWDASVSAYRVLDAEGAWIAGFYVDPYPRENKQSGAWMDGLISCGRDDTTRRPLGVLVANVTPPVGGGDALLTHREVQTMFHELGHLMHHCLSRTELVSQAGTQVAWDFVELPSQIFENWCWEREALDLFAKHTETGEPLPDALLGAMQRARTFRAASGQMRQLGFAHMDLALHIDYDAGADGDVTAYAHKLMEPFAATELPAEHAMVASFGHLFGAPVGYASGYYSYKWAEVLDADAFTRFKREGLFNPEVGQAFRAHILERGDEDDPAALYRNFMGRDPDLSPLLTRLGLQ